MTGTSGTTPSDPANTPAAQPSGKATLTVPTPESPDTTARATLETNQPAADKILDTSASTTGPGQGATGVPSPATASLEPATGRATDTGPSGRADPTGSASESRWETQYRTLRDQYDRLAASVSQQGRDLGQRASEVYDRTTDHIQRQGRRGVATAQGTVMDYPLVSVLVAFGVGYLIGRVTASGTSYRTDTDYETESGRYPYHARDTDTGSGAEGGRYPYRARDTDAGSGTESNRYPYQARYTNRD